MTSGWTDCRCTSLLKTLMNNANRNIDYLRSLTGLPMSTCFSALKIKWLLENNKSVQESIERGALCFGTIDSWLIWVSVEQRNIFKHNHKHILSILESYWLRSLWGSCYRHYKRSIHRFNEYKFYGMGFKTVQVLQYSYANTAKNTFQF